MTRIAKPLIGLTVWLLCAAVAPADEPSRWTVQQGSLVQHDAGTHADPTRIAPTRRDWRHNAAGGTTTFVFAPQSFTIIRFGFPPKGW